MQLFCDDVLVPCGAGMLLSKSLWYRNLSGAGIFLVPESFWRRVLRVYGKDEESLDRHWRRWGYDGEFTLFFEMMRCELR